MAAEIQQLSMEMELFRKDVGDVIFKTLQTTRTHLKKTNYVRNGVRSSILFLSM